MGSAPSHGMEMTLRSKWPSAGRKLSTAISVITVESAAAGRENSQLVRRVKLWFIKLLCARF